MNTFRYLESGIQLTLYPERCIGCGSCADVCPHRVFIVNNKKAVINDMGGCMECGACQLNCPTCAISVNTDEGCGCATLLIKKWLNRFLGREFGGSGCC